MRIDIRKFSLRTLFIAMSLLCLALGAFALRSHSANRQREALDKIESIGGEIYYDYDSIENDSIGERDSVWLNWVPDWSQDILDVDFFHDVTKIEIYRNENLEDHEVATALASIELLRDFENIEVEFQSVGESANWLSSVGPLKQVRSISLSPLDFKDASAARELLEDMEEFHNITALTLSMLKLDDDILGLIKSRTELESLNLNGAMIPDNNLVFLQNLHNLKWLCLAGVPITNKELVHLKDLTSLETLVLVETNITGEGLLHLAELPRIQSLNLSNTKLHDDDMQSIACHEQLETLYLYSCDITDQGLISLYPLKALRTIGLANTKVSDNGVRLLKKAIPEVSIDL